MSESTEPTIATMLVRATKDAIRILANLLSFGATSTSFLPATSIMGMDLLKLQFKKLKASFDPNYKPGTDF